MKVGRERDCEGGGRERVIKILINNTNIIGIIQIKCSLQ